jgi:hypothetical protein
MMRWISNVALLCSALALLVLVPASGQTLKGNILRTITDSTRGVVPAVRVLVTETMPHTVYNQYGGSLGGRVLRDRLFFFGDFQGSRDILGQIAITTIPTMALRGGDLSASPTTIYDPRTGKPDGTGRTPFPGNQIPAEGISSIAKQYLSFLPPPTTPGLVQNYRASTIKTNRSNSSTSRSIT